MAGDREQQQEALKGVVTIGGQVGVLGQQSLRPDHESL